MCLNIDERDKIMDVHQGTYLGTFRLELWKSEGAV